MSRKSIADTRRLNDNYECPVFGFGLYLSPPEVSEASTSAALKAGYLWYENGAQAGAAIAKSGVPRDQVFLSTKHLASPDDPDLLATTRRIVKETGLDYVDSFLIHSPSCGPEVRRRFWQALEELQQEGLTKSIGVANYGVEHFKQMKDYARVPPAICQIELHPFMQQEDIVEYCEQHQIAIEAYCPLIRGEKMSEPTLVKIANECKKDVAQVLLRWSLQKGYLPLPKSDNPKRIVSNAEIFDFELTEAQMNDITALGKGQRLALAPDNTRCP